MNFIDFLFKLLKAVVPVSDSEYSIMKGDAENWWHGIIIDEGKEKGSKLELFIKKWSSEWWFKIVLGFAYPFAKRELFYISNPELAHQEEEEED